MPLARDVAGIAFHTPIVLAAGTAGYGRELAGTVDLDCLGGLITKATSLRPVGGNRPPRVAEFDAGMLNSVGLANPGADAVRDDALPWLARERPSLRVLVNVVGFAIEEYAAVIARLDDVHGHAGYELNLSCPNTAAGGIEFGADERCVTEIISRCRAVTRRPLFAKLSPVLPDIPRMARVATEAGASGVSLVNTLPGIVFDGGATRVGNGFGGVSGPALRPVALLAVQRTARALPGCPIIASGGVATADHVRDFLRAGAALVAIGTAALADPRLPQRIVAELEASGG
ncbi:MAG: dihydroorotate dehydrogenase [Gemmatimonadales bacterium]